MNRYTQIGTGDFTPDYPEDTRQQCLYCNEHFTPASGEPDLYCCLNHWHLHSIGEVKSQVLCWIKAGFSEKSILIAMRVYWFEWMTDSTVNRWKRAIHALFEEKPAETA